MAVLSASLFAANAAPQAVPFQQLVKEAEAARQEDRLPEAIQIYQKALHQRPDWSQGWWWLGSIYYDQDLYAEARDAFTQSVRHSEKPMPAYAFLGLCEYELRDYAKARVHLTKWLADGAPGDAQLADVARFRREELLIQNGHFLEALLLLNQDVQGHGPDPARVEAMGLAWMQIKAVPEEYPAEKREMVWLAGSASAWMSAGKMDRCKEFLDRLAAHYGNQTNVHSLRGFADESLKDTSGAISEYKKELEIAPQTVEPTIQLALLLADNGQQEEAMAAASRAVSLEPANAQSQYALGRALFAGEKWAESAAAFEKAMSLAPNASKIRFQLARAYRKLGRSADAKLEDAAFETLSKKEQGGNVSANPAQLKQQLQERAR